MARLCFCGAAGTVTGSMHRIETGSRSLLLDCGLYQGRRKEAFRRNREFPFRAADIDAVLLSHAHIDHCGNLPGLVRAGFDGPIRATAATADLARVMLMDSAEIQESDVEYVNRDRRREGKRPFEPLYTVADARRTLALFETIDYATPTEVLPGVTATFVDAGHMLGSASLSVRIDEPGNKPVTLAFSGDIGRTETPILRDPEYPDGADYVLMESTYGDRVHAARSDVGRLLHEAVRRVFDQGGVLLIPAFSVGRTQEIIYRLNELAEADRLPEMPVFIDSPMANEAMEVFRSHPECFDDETIRRISTESDRDPLGFRHLHPIRTADQSRRLNDFDGPCVIIAASGMCESGRILHHLKHHVSKPSTFVLFAGFQAPETLGRRILEGRSPVSILGRQVEVRASVERLEGLSGHADRNELLDWLDQVRSRGSVREVALVHGEPAPAESLAAAIRQRTRLPVRVPRPGETWELNG
ncbi:MAG TPA: MBL fold metallo-hydrolase [Planctomycetaceae bacterium]|nr:MBL fold metallo-hydrolase [Planctomycetaceae bacterium]HRE99841.1 MBL fold metallo-hydrolase [Pirellulaceae bacterium]